MTSILDNIALKLADLELRATLSLVEVALKNDYRASEILADGLSKGMDEIGKRFEQREYFIADLVAASHIVKEAMKILKNKLKTEVSSTGFQGKVIFGTVEGDLHDIGKNITISLLTAAGYGVYDLGVDVSANTFLKKVKEVKPDIVALSALLLTTLRGMAEVVDTLKEAGLRDQVYIMIGGRPTNDEFAKEIGVDTYCATAMEGLTKANQYMRQKRGVA